MISKISSFILVVLLCYPATLISQMTSLDIFSSHFTYKDPGKERYLTDIYVNIPESEIKKLQFFGLDTIEVICEIMEKEKKITKGWHCFSLRSLKGGIGKKEILDFFTVALKKGNYVFDVKIYPRDRTVPIFGHAEAGLSIKAYEKNNIAVSDILISDRISKPPANDNRFIKSGLWVQPFPSREFSAGQPLLYFYWEIANIQGPVKKDYKIQATINDISGKKVKTLKAHHVTKTNKVIFFTGQNIIALKGGVYTLNLEAIEGGKSIARKSTSFSMYKKPKVVEAPVDSSQIDDMFMAMTDEQIENEIMILRPIMKEKTFNSVAKMSIGNKKVSLTKFWQANDFNPETPENEFRADYLERVEYVRTTFEDDNLGVDGIDTDMGRIVLQYGKPDIINRNVDDEMAGRDVELWKIYKFQAIFLFVQENFIGPHRLVHSTMRGEIQDPMWEDYLEANPELMNF